MKSEQNVFVSIYIILFALRSQYFWNSDRKTTLRITPECKTKTKSYTNITK